MERLVTETATGYKYIAAILWFQVRPDHFAKVSRPGMGVVFCVRLGNANQLLIRRALIDWQRS